MNETQNLTPRHATLLAMLVFLVTLLWYSSGLTQRPIYSRGEGREALVVSAMLDSGDFILPLRNGDTVPSKPPLFHWLAAATAKASGSMNEFSMRFPSALCAALSIAALFVFSVRFAGVRHALASTSILATTALWNRSSTEARVDMVFSCCVILATLSLFQNIQLMRTRGSYSLGWWVVALLTSVASTLAKGPAGLLLPWIIAGVYVLVSHDKPLRQVFQAMPIRPFMLTFGAAFFLSAIWYWLAYLHLGHAFIDKQLFQENVTRLMEYEGEERGHRKPFYYSVILLILGFLPWSILFPVLGAYLWRQRSTLRAPEHAATLFCLVWIAVFIGAVTVSISKREVYLLACYPAVAFLVGSVCLSVLEPSVAVTWSRKASATLLGAVAVGVVLFVVGARYISAAIADPSSTLGRKGMIGTEFQEILRVVGNSPGLAGCTILSAALCMTAVVFLWKGRLALLPQTLGPSMLALAAALNTFILPDLALARTPRGFMDEVRKIVPPEAPLYRYKSDFFAATYYARRNIPQIDEAPSTTLTNDVYLIVRDDMLDELRAETEAAQKKKLKQVLIKTEGNTADGQGKLLLVVF